jgi:hypothetical protein
MVSYINFKRSSSSCQRNSSTAVACAGASVSPFLVDADGFKLIHFISLAVAVTLYILEDLQRIKLRASSVQFFEETTDCCYVV